jgi:hypothetical protein
VLQNAASVVTGIPMTVSVYAKAGARNWLYVAGNSGAAGTFVNLTTGAFGTQFSLTDRNIVSAGNGWYWISITFVATTAQVRFDLASADGTTNYTGNGSGNVYLYGAGVSQPKVSQWSDQSLNPATGASNGHHLIQATAASQMLWTPHGWNGRPALHADGADDFMKTAPAALNQPETVMIAFTINTYGSSTVHDILLDGNTNGSMTIGTVDATSYAISSGVAITLTRAVANKEGVVMTNIWNTTGIIRCNGQQLQSGGVGANNAGGLTLGALSDGTRSYAADYHALAAFSGQPSDYHLQLWERFFMRRHHPRRSI